MPFQPGNIPKDILSHLDILGLEVFRQYQFAVSMDGDIYGSQWLLGFNKIMGLEGSVELRDVQEGGHPGSYTFPRRHKSSQLKLIRGMTFNTGLWDWFVEVKNWKKGKPNYSRTLSIVMLDYLSTRQMKGSRVPYEVWRFDVIDAWPSEWKGPELDSDSEGLAFESIIIQHGGITKATSIITGETASVISILQQ